jgi:hypothetical protein
MPTLEKKSEFARRRGVTRALMTTWEKKGFLVLSTDGSGRVDVEASNVLLDAREPGGRGRRCSPPSGEAVGKPEGRNPTAIASKEPAPLPASPAASPDEWTTAEAVRRRECANARLKQLEYEQRAGRLLDAAEVENTWRAYLGDCRKRLLTVPSRCGARLSHLSRAEVGIIDREIRDALQELAEDPT